MQISSAHRSYEYLHIYFCYPIFEPFILMYLNPVPDVFGNFLTLQFSYLDTVILINYKSYVLLSSFLWNLNSVFDFRKNNIVSYDMSTQISSIFILFYTNKNSNHTSQKHPFRLQNPNPFIPTKFVNSKLNIYILTQASHLYFRIYAIKLVKFWSYSRDKY